jgi:hypothetical protein
MDQAKLVARIGRANGIAARVLGAPHDLFRPQGASAPLALANRVMRLSASFNVRDMRYGKAPDYGHGLYYGVFDNSVTQPGDYLSGAAGIYFIAAQRPLLPTLCVLTNRFVSFARAGGATAAGANAYGGVTSGGSTVLAANWPASLLGNGGGQQGVLPSDATIPSWSMLLPALPVVLRTSDLVSDDLGRSFVVASAEQSSLGWRLVISQAAT